MNLFIKSHNRNYSDNMNKTKQNIESTNDYYENSLKTIVNNFKKIKINFKNKILTKIKIKILQKKIILRF